MQQLFIAFAALSLMLVTTSCHKEEPVEPPPVEKPEVPVLPDEGENDGGNEESDKEDDYNQGNNESIPMNSRMEITIGNAIFRASLYNNATAAAFKSRLPITVQMAELNGNEKYYNFPDRLPTEASYSGTIHEGDLMIWGANCLVLFYESFSTSFSYTKIGSIDNPSDLKTAVGSSNVTITFKLI